MTPQKKIGLFGGTFDPVHLGHLHLAVQAREALGLDEIRFLPCRISPHKSDTAPASGEDRCKMLRLATAGLPWAVVDDCELHQQGPSYSYQTAEALKARLPGARLFWIMGGDQWSSLHRWKSPERLAELVEFVVLARGEAPLPRQGFEVHGILGEHPASATVIRHDLSKGLKNHPWLNPKVAEWIAEKKLYQAPHRADPARPDRP
jgi:nicotinate-nucleotide adenylyltransferase